MSPGNRPQQIVMNGKVVKGAAGVSEADSPQRTQRHAETDTTLEECIDDDIADSCSSLCVLCALCGAIARRAADGRVASARGVGQRGTEFTLTLTGARLDDPQELMLYAPGVACTKLAAKSENEVTATLKAAADCRLGEYAVPAPHAGGASELRTFRITPFPVVAEKEPNDAPKQRSRSR